MVCRSNKFGQASLWHGIQFIAASYLLTFVAGLIISPNLSGPISDKLLIMFKVFATVLE